MAISRSLRVLLVDDHTMFRKGLANLMASRPDMEVVGEAANGLEAVEKARALIPDLILMDLKMPVCDGIKAIRLITQELPSIRIVVLTVSDEDNDLFEALKAGAHGYLLKDLTPEALFELLRGVMVGESPLSPAVASRVLKEFRRQGTPDQPVLSPLSPREVEVLQLVAEGASNYEIARRLGVAPGTVKNHLHNALTKLQLKNRAQAVAYALQEGLIRPPQGNGQAS